MYKISIILPVFNVEKLLERALNSIINQTMDLNDIEVIMVDDCSTDGSRKIMEKYSKIYPNFISLYHEKNSGGCGFPRNTGLEVASGEYVMFLDADDEYLPDNCEKLYNIIKKYDADIAFGRYERIYPHLNKVEISYSPFYINMEDYFSQNKFANVNSSKNNSFKHKLDDYFNSIDNYDYDNPMEIIYTKKIEDNFQLLKIPPSVWTKLYKRKFLMENNFHFQRHAAEDLVFVLDTFLKADGIIFLNNYAGHVYYKYEAEENESMTNNVSFKLLDEICDSSIKCGMSTISFPNVVRTYYVNPQLTNLFVLWKNSNLDKDETVKLIKKLRKIKEVYKGCFKTNLLIILIINFIKISSHV